MTGIAETPARTERRMPWFFLAARPGLTRLLVVIMLLVLWEVLVDLFGDPLFLTTPSRILMNYASLLGTNGIGAALYVTAWELGFAFLLSVVFGVGLGLAIGMSGFGRASFMPIVLLLYATPQVTIMPVFMMVFGIGPASKVAYGFSHGIFPILITVAAGVRDLKALLNQSAYSMGAGRMQILRHVVMPQLMPSLFTGMRLGMTATLLGVILAELYVSVTGVGYFSRRFAEAFQPTQLFGLIALVAAIAIIINETLRIAELRLTRWREA